MVVGGCCAGYVNVQAADAVAVAVQARREACAALVAADGVKVALVACAAAVQVDGATSPSSLKSMSSTSS